MSTEPSPEVTEDDVTEDDSELAPHQTDDTPEWPKKLRALTASELDRLSIDENGRFHWDGKLVDYEPPEFKEICAKLLDSQDRSALEILDRAAHELGDYKTSESIERTGLQRPGDTPADLNAHGLTDLNTIRPANENAIAAAIAESRLASNVNRIADGVSLKLSFWQTLGAVVVVLGIAAGAIGVAVYGFATAHEWGCRTKLIQNYCPVAPADRPPQRPEIPA